MPARGPAIITVMVTEDLDEALNEATVTGLRLRLDGRVVILLDVLALPEHGPADPDPRRALVLSGVSTVRVLLRRERPAEGPLEVPRRPRPDRRLACGDQFGAHLGPSGAAHSLYWFNECGLPAPDGFSPHCIEGVVDFTELAVERAAVPVAPTPAIKLS